MNAVTVLDLIRNYRSVVIQTLNQLTNESNIDYDTLGDKELIIVLNDLLNKNDNQINKKYKQENINITNIKRQEYGYNNIGSFGYGLSLSSSSSYSSNLSALNPDHPNFGSAKIYKKCHH